MIYGYHRQAKTLIELAMHEANLPQSCGGQRYSAKPIPEEELERRRKADLALYRVLVLGEAP